MDVMDVLSQVMNLLLVLVIGLLVMAVPVVFFRARKWFETQVSNLPENVRDALENAALLAARFVEQLGVSEQLAEGIEDMAVSKMNVAVSWAIKYLEAQGYDISDATEEQIRESLRGLIENVILAGLHKKEAAVGEAVIYEMDAAQPPF